MTSWAGTGSRLRTAERDRPTGPTWRGVAVIGALLVLAFVVSRSCQQAQIRITKEQAIATAQEQVDFRPENTQIRLLRQGLNRQPFWIVSLSIPLSEDEGTFRRLALVRIDANTGKVASVEEQGPREQPAGATGKDPEQTGSAGQPEP